MKISSSKTYEITYDPHSHIACEISMSLVPQYKAIHMIIIVYIRINLLNDLRHKHETWSVRNVCRQVSFFLKTNKGNNNNVVMPWLNEIL